METIHSYVRKHVCFDSYLAGCHKTSCNCCTVLRNNYNMDIAYFLIKRYDHNSYTYSTIRYHFDIYIINF